MGRFLEAGLLLLLVLAAAQDGHSRVTDKGEETFLVKYKNGAEIVPVSVKIDYTEQEGHVISVSPRSQNQALTLYDFQARVIAFKHVPSQNCFIMRMKHENIHREQRLLQVLKDGLINGTNPAVFYASRESLSPASLYKVAGAKIYQFCRQTKAYLITSNKNLGRPKRQIDDYTQRSYSHYGQQTQSYSNFGHNRLANGKVQPPSPPPFNSRGLPPLSPSPQQNGSPANPSANHRGSDAQEHVLRFPIPPSQNGDDSSAQYLRMQDPRVAAAGVQDPRTQDPRIRDPRVHDQRTQEEPTGGTRTQDPRQGDQNSHEQRVRDTRSHDSRVYDPRYRSTDLRLSGPYPTSRDASRRSNYGPVYNRGAATDPERGAFAGGLAADSSRGFRNITLTFNKFDSDSSLPGTGILSNTKVNVDNAGTNAVAASTGQLNEQRSQSQVQGNYAGAGSFSAQAQAGFLQGTSQSQVRGGSDGGSSISSANVERLGSAQSQVQLGTPDGKSSGSAQGNFARGGTQAEAQGSRGAGTASAQALSPGLSQSSATVNARGEGHPRERFLGEVVASTRGDLLSGMSNTNLQGGFGPDKTYSARAEGAFNSQSSYSPLSGLPSSGAIGDRLDISGDVPSDYRYTPARSPYDTDFRYTTTQPPFDQQPRERVYPDYRYTTSTTPSPYIYPARDTGDTRRTDTSPDPRYPGQDLRRSGVSVQGSTFYYPQSVGKGPAYPSPYDQGRRAYVAPTQTKSQVPQPPPRAYVYPDSSRKQPQPQTKSQLPSASYPRAYLQGDLSSQASTSSRQVSCCRVRREHHQYCCRVVPHAECCPGPQRQQQTRPRRYLSDEHQKEASNCQPVCYTGYKIIGQARICQHSSNC